MDRCDIVVGTRVRLLSGDIEYKEQVHAGMEGTITEDHGTWFGVSFLPAGWQSPIILGFDKQTCLGMFEVALGELFYMEDTRRGAVCGNCTVWWAKNNAGYVCDIREARLFTKEEAEHQHRMRDTDVPWPKEIVEHLAVPHVRYETLRRLMTLEGSAEMQAILAKDPLPVVPGHIVQSRTVYEVDPPAGPSGPAGPGRC
jgi:hypothetical protein